MEHPHQELIRRVGKVMRERDEATDEPLPERWVELINYLNEKERREPPSQHPAR